MSTSTIRNTVAAIGDYHKTPETKSRAEELINDLTSDERKAILQIIKESNADIPEPNKLAKKLQQIHNIDRLNSKDADLSEIQIILMNIWRTVKDIFGFRISDKDLLKKIDAYSEREGLMSDARADIPELFFTTSDSLEMQLAIAKKTANFDKEIIPVTEYQILGLNYVDSSFSLEELESAYRTILKNYQKDPVRLFTAKRAFQTAYAIEQVKNEFLTDQTKPLTLKAAAEFYRTFTDSQKKKLTFLIKIYTAFSLFQVEQDTQ